jgi:hypothetical protein
MKIKELILEEHSKAQTDRIVQYVANDRKKFAELMNLFLNGEYRVSQRAGWPLSYCAQRYPELVKPYFRKLLDMLDKPGIHDAVIRNIVRILQYVEIPSSLHGRLMNKCFEYISSNSTPVAIKAFSLTVLENLSKHYPGISQELKLVIEERMPHETAAFSSRAKKILKKLDKKSGKRAIE